MSDDRSTGRQQVRRWLPAFRATDLEPATAKAGNKAGNAAAAIHEEPGT